MKELRIRPQTYYGDSAQARRLGEREFDGPRVPMVAYSSEGLRVVLGSHDRLDLTVPDLQIERRANGWAIFLHPLGGSDPCAVVFFLDDGRSFLVREVHGGPTPRMVEVEPDEEVPEIDSLRPHE